jgi:hypothetical protein
MPPEAPDRQCLDLVRFLSGALGENAKREDLSPSKIAPIFQTATKILTRNIATTKPRPSVFKQSAAVILGFMAHAPLQLPILSTSYQAKSAPQILTIPNHQNAVYAFEYVRFALHGATVEHCTKGVITIDNHVWVSPHFYGDLVHAIASLKQEDGCFHFIALLIESLVYKNNPLLPYDGQV